MALPALLSGLGKQLLADGAKGAIKSALFGKKDNGGGGNKPPDKGESGSSFSTKGNSLAIRPSSSIVPFGESFKNDSSGNNKGGNTLLTIKEKVIKIENLLGESYAFKKKQAEKTRITSEKENRKRREKLLEETSEEKKNSGKNNIPVPGKGLFDNLIGRVFNFLFWITVGKSLPTIEKFLPQIVGIIDVLFKIMDVIISVVGTILDVVITFVDWGFRAWDQVRGAAKAIGGDGLVDALDKFTGVVDTILNLLFIASMAAAAGGLFDRSGSKSPEKQNRPKITESGGKPLRRRDKIFDKLKSPFGSRGGPTITGDVPGGRRNRGPFNRGPKITGTPEAPKPKGRNIFSGLYEGAVGAYKGISERVGNLYKNTIGKLAESANNLIKQGPKKLMEWMSNQKGIIGELGKKLPGFFDSPLIKKLGKALPFVGDVVGFVFDIIDGIDWRRALIRAVVGATIDAGFNSLAAALVAATPFTGGASTAVAIALYASYMAADVASGGFGKILGDKVADFLKLPVKAGQNGGPSPKTAGSESDLKSVQSEIDKKVSEDPKFAEKIGRVPQETEDLKSSVPARRYGGFIEYKDGPQKLDEVLAKKFGGIVPLAFQEGGIISNDYELDPESKLKNKTDNYQKIKSTKVNTSLPNITSAATYNKNVIDVYSGEGIKKLIDLGNEFKDVPVIGSSMYAAINVALGNKVSMPVIETIANDLLYFAKVDSFGKSSSLSELNTMQNGGMVTKDFSEIQLDTEESKLTLSKFLYNKVNQQKVKKVSESDKEESESGNAWWDPLGLFKSKEKKRAQEDPTSPDSPTPDGSTPSNVGGGSFEANLAKLLKSYEGLRTKAYKDAVGIPTIGMGATYYPKGFRLSGKVKMSDTITEEEALWIKQQHIKEHRQRLLREVPSSIYSKVPDNVKAALESKVFNYGSLGGPLTNLVKSASSSGNYSSVSSYFRNTLAKHDGGLNSWRRNDEAGVIDTGVSKRAGVSFPKQSGSEAQKSYETPAPGGKAKEPSSASPVVGGDGKFIQGNSGASAGVHFHIGPGSQVKGTILQKQYYADARQTAKATIDHFLKKGSKIYDGRRGVYYKSSNEVDAAQKAHTASGSGGGIDLQVDFEKQHPFPLKTEGMKYRPNGFGVSADIVGSNSFVAHGRYDEKGKVAPQERMKIYQGGGLISPIKNQIIPDSFASYEEPGGTNTKIIMVPIPVPSQSPSMSHMVSKSLQSVPEVRSLNSMGGRMDSIHQLSRS